MKYINLVVYLIENHKVKKFLKALQKDALRKFWLMLAICVERALILCGKNSSHNALYRHCVCKHSRYINWEWVVDNYEKLKVQIPGIDKYFPKLAEYNGVKLPE